MPTSQNGWSASRDLALRQLRINGTTIVPGIRDDDDVATVLGYVLQQFNDRVEPLRNPGCWGFSYRENRNDPTSLSNHASGTAVDVNAPAHPNGVPTQRTFTVDQVVEVHRILIEVKSAVRWGGDYHGTPDAMHFEINTDPATLRAVADGLRDDMPKYSEWDQADKDALAGDVVDQLLGRKVKLPDGKVRDVEQLLIEIHNARN